MKVSIIGSRGLNNIDIKNYIPKEATCIVSGGAKGVDTLAERYAKENNLSTIIYLPDYKAFGKIAPIIRNRLIVGESDLIVAIWDGKSKGTKYTIDYAKKTKKQVLVYKI